MNQMSSREYVLRVASAWRAWFSASGRKWLFTLAGVDALKGVALVAFNPELGSAQFPVAMAASIVWASAALCALVGLSPYRVAQLERNERMSADRLRELAVDRSDQLEQHAARLQTKLGEQEAKQRAAQQCRVRASALDGLYSQLTGLALQGKELLLKLENPAPEVWNMIPMPTDGPSDFHKQVYDWISRVRTCLPHTWHARWPHYPISLPHAYNRDRALGDLRARLRVLGEMIIAIRKQMRVAAE